MKHILLIVIAATALTGCEKVVDLNYKNNLTTITIEGNITNESGPYYIRVTKSVHLSETESYPAIDDATVTIRDNAGHSETLVPQGNGRYRCDEIIGTEGRTYSLTVQADGKTYIAQSTMPERVPFDSIKIEELASMGETEYNIIPVYTDPEAASNKYHFLVSVNNRPVNQHFIQDDDIKNGATNTFRLELNNNDYPLKKGDAINITMQCVDTNVGLFYKTLMLMGDSGPGGGTTPANPPNNISNGALGLFSAHTVETRQVVIP